MIEHHQFRTCRLSKKRSLILADEEEELHLQRPSATLSAAVCGRPVAKAFLDAASIFLFGWLEVSNNAHFHSVLEASAKLLADALPL